MSQTPAVVVVPAKNVGIAALLTILFGPLGMLYSTVPGAIVMLLVSLVAGGITLGLGVVVTWPICILWGAIAAKNYNRKILGQLP